MTSKDIRSTNPLLRQRSAPSVSDLADAMLSHDVPVRVLAKPGGMALDADGTIPAGSFSITRLGLVMRSGATEGDWRAAGAAIALVGEAYQWLVGDWLTIGEHRWGRSYQEAAAALGLEYNTVKDWAWVAANVDLSIRTDKLPWSAHRLIASIESDDDKRAWLAAAADNGWSVARLRAELQMATTGELPARPSATERYAMLAIRLQDGLQKFVQQASADERGQLAAYLRVLADQIDGAQA